jgi:hypothetical protein
VPIKPVHGCKTLVEDITTASCYQKVKEICKKIRVLKKNHFILAQERTWKLEG